LINASSDSGSRTEFAARFGTGIDFYFSEHWVLNFEASYVLPTGDLSEYDYIGGGMGLEYRF
jgi:hypothetical protein